MAYYVPERPYPEQERAIELYLKGELGIKEFAGMLGCSVSSAKTAVCDIIKALYKLNKIKYEK